MNENSPKNRDNDWMFGRIADLHISPTEYYQIVRDFNKLIQHELKEKLNNSATDLGDVVTLVTLGSDARYEKGSFMSPLEVIAVVNQECDLDSYRETLTEVVSKVSPTKLAKIIEMKGPKSSLVKTYGDRYQPGRIADSRLIYGDPDIFKKTKVKLGEEIVALSSHEMDHIGNLKRDARKVTESGVNRLGGVDAIHFDLTKGLVFYNPEAHQLSFKIGPLRLVQNTLLIEEAKHVRNRNNTNFFSNLEPNIVERLSQIHDDGLISLEKSSIEEIAEHYAFFLRLYHKSERAYEHKGEIAIQLNQEQVVDISKRLKALLKLMENLKFKK